MRFYSIGANGYRRLFSPFQLVCHLMAFQTIFFSSFIPVNFEYELNSQVREGLADVNGYSSRDLTISHSFLGLSLKAGAPSGQAGAPSGQAGGDGTSSTPTQGGSGSGGQPSFDEIMNFFASGLQRFSITQGSTEIIQVPCADLANLAPLVSALLSQLESEVNDISDEAPLKSCLDKLLEMENMTHTPQKKLKKSIEKVRKNLDLQLALSRKSRGVLEKGRDLEELLLSYLVQCNLGIHTAITMSSLRSKLLSGLPGKVESTLKKITAFKSGLTSMYKDNCSEGAFQGLIKELQKLLDRGEPMEVEEHPAGASGH